MNFTKLLEEQKTAEGYLKANDNNNAINSFRNIIDFDSIIPSYPFFLT
jgi:hypothetical protein